MSYSYKINNDKYIKISCTDEGFDYSYYDNDKKLIDGGLIDFDAFVEKFMIEFVTPEILKMISLNSKEVNLEQIEEIIEGD